MTSTNNGKDVKSNENSGLKAKSYYINLYKSLESSLNNQGTLEERSQALTNAWGEIHNLCLHSAPSTHPHLLIWLQKHTSRTLLQSEWQSPSSTPYKLQLETVLTNFITKINNDIESEGKSHSWKIQLLARAVWFKSILSDPWGHAVLRKLLDQRGEQPSDDEVLAWLKDERGVMFVARLRQLTSSKCDDLALSLAVSVMDRVRATLPPVDDENDGNSDPHTEMPEANSVFGGLLTKSAGFTSDVWEMLTDIEFVLLHKLEKTDRCIELAKQTPLRIGYQLVERLRMRLESSPREKKLWKNAKDVATLIAQVVIARCMVVRICVGVPRAALYCCARSLVRLAPRSRLRLACAALAAPAASARHLHSLAAAVHAQCGDEMKSFVCELYVRAITAGTNELEKLKIKTEKDSETRVMEQTLSSWFEQLGSLLSSSPRVNCECLLTAFSVHPTANMYEKLREAPELTNFAKEKIEQDCQGFNSWANDSHTQTNLVKTSETLNMTKANQLNVMSTAIFTEGEAIGLNPELCQDLAVLLSGPRVKTLSWDMDREKLLENCRTYMERTGGGTKSLMTELKYLNLDPSQYQHLPEEDDGEDDAFYGIEKGYEHLLQMHEPEEIWADAASDPDRGPGYLSDESIEAPKVKKKNKKFIIKSDDEEDPLRLDTDTTKKDKARKIKEGKKKKVKQTEPTDVKVDNNEPNTSKVKLKDKPKKERKKMTDEEKKERIEKRKKEKRLQKELNNVNSSLLNLIGVKIGDYENTATPNCSSSKVDYSAGIKSPESTLVYDGLYSMEELKTVSPQKPILNAPKVVTPKVVPSPHANSQARVTKPVTVETVAKPTVNNSPIKPTTMGSHIQDDVKARIYNLLTFRKPKIIDRSPIPNEAKIQNFIDNVSSTSENKQEIHSDNPQKHSVTSKMYKQYVEHTISNRHEKPIQTKTVKDMLIDLKDNKIEVIKQVAAQNYPSNLASKQYLPVSTNIQSTIAKNTVTPKQAEIAPNTFARLSYAYKNKLSAGKNIQSNNSISIKSEREAISDEIERSIAEFKLKKLQAMAAGNLSVSKVPISQTQYNNQITIPNLQGNLPEKPIIQQNKMANSTVTILKRKDNKVLANNPCLSEILKTPVISPPITKPKSSFTELDQKDLVNLWIQQSKMMNRPIKNPNTTVKTTTKEATKKKVRTKQTPTKPKNFQSNFLKHITQQAGINKRSNALMDQYKKSESMLLTTQLNPSDIKNVYNKNPDSMVHSFVTKDKNIPHSSNEADSQQDWESVMDAILSHKTPKRQSALDITLNNALSIKSSTPNIQALDHANNNNNKNTLTTSAITEPIKMQEAISTRKCTKPILLTPPTKKQTVPNNSSKQMTQSNYKIGMSDTSNSSNDYKKETKVKILSVQTIPKGLTSTPVVTNNAVTSLNKGKSFKPSLISLGTKLTKQNTVIAPKPSCNMSKESMDELALLDEIIDQELLKEIDELSDDESKLPAVKITQNSNSKYSTGMLGTNLIDRKMYPNMSTDVEINFPRSSNTISSAKTYTVHVQPNVYHPSVIINNNLTGVGEQSVSVPSVSTVSNVVMVPSLVYETYNTAAHTFPTMSKQKDVMVNLQSYNYATPQRVIVAPVASTSAPSTSKDNIMIYHKPTSLVQNNLANSTASSDHKLLLVKQSNSNYVDDSDIISSLLNLKSGNLHDPIQNLGVTKPILTVDKSKILLNNTIYNHGKDNIPNKPTQECGKQFKLNKANKSNSSVLILQHETVDKNISNENNSKVSGKGNIINDNITETAELTTEIIKKDTEVEKIDDISHTMNDSESTTNCKENRNMNVLVKRNNSKPSINNNIEHSNEKHTPKQVKTKSTIKRNRTKTNTLSKINKKVIKKSNSTDINKTLKPDTTSHNIKNVNTVESTNTDIGEIDFEDALPNKNTIPKPDKTNNIIQKVNPVESIYADTGVIDFEEALSAVKITKAKQSKPDYDDSFLETNSIMPSKKSSESKTLPKKQLSLTNLLNKVIEPLANKKVQNKVTEKVEDKDEMPHKKKQEMPSLDFIKLLKIEPLLSMDLNQPSKKMVRLILPDKTSFKLTIVSPNEVTLDALVKLPMVYDLIMKSWKNYEAYNSRETVTTHSEYGPLKIKDMTQTELNQMNSKNMKVNLIRQDDALIRSLQVEKSISENSISSSDEPMTKNENSTNQNTEHKVLNRCMGTNIAQVDFSQSDDLKCFDIVDNDQINVNSICEIAYSIPSSTTVNSDMIPEILAFDSSSNVGSLDQSEKLADVKMDCNVGLIGPEGEIIHKDTRCSSAHERNELESYELTEKPDSFKEDIPSVLISNDASTNLNLKLTNEMKEAELDRSNIPIDSKDMLEITSAKQQDKAVIDSGILPENSSIKQQGTEITVYDDNPNNVNKLSNDEKIIDLKSENKLENKTIKTIPIVKNILENSEESENDKQSNIDSNIESKDIVHKIQEIDDIIELSDEETITSQIKVDDTKIDQRADKTSAVVETLIKLGTCDLLSETIKLDLKSDTDLTHADTTPEKQILAIDESKVNSLPIPHHVDFEKSSNMTRSKCDSVCKEEEKTTQVKTAKVTDDLIEVVDWPVESPIKFGTCYPLSDETLESDVVSVIDETYEDATSEKHILPMGETKLNALLIQKKRIDFSDVSTRVTQPKYDTVSQEKDHPKALDKSNISVVSTTKKLLDSPENFFNVNLINKTDGQEKDKPTQLKKVKITDDYIIDLIDLDDSSSDCSDSILENELSNHQIKTVDAITNIVIKNDIKKKDEPGDKIDVLKQLLLQDIVAVLKPVEEPIEIDLTSDTEEEIRPNSLTKQVFINLEKCDKLAQLYKIAKNPGFIILKRCDESNKSKYCKPDIDFRCESPSILSQDIFEDVTIDERIKMIDENSNPSSPVMEIFDMLTDKDELPKDIFENLTVNNSCPLTPVIELFEVFHDDSEMILNNNVVDSISNRNGIMSCTSPVMEMFEVFTDREPILKKYTDTSMNNPLSCFSEWYLTKPDLAKESLPRFIPPNLINITLNCINNNDYNNLFSHTKKFKLCLKRKLDLQDFYPTKLLKQHCCLDESLKIENDYSLPVHTKKITDAINDFNIDLSYAKSDTSKSNNNIELLSNHETMLERVFESIIHKPNIDTDKSKNISGPHELQCTHETDNSDNTKLNINMPTFYPELELADKDKCTEISNEYATNMSSKHESEHRKRNLLPESVKFLNTEKHEQNFNILEDYKNVSIDVTVEIQSISDNEATMFLQNDNKHESSPNNVKDTDTVSEQTITNQDVLNSDQIILKTSQPNTDDSLICEIGIINSQYKAINKTSSSTNNSLSQDSFNSDSSELYSTERQKNIISDSPDKDSQKHHNIEDESYSNIPPIIIKGIEYKNPLIGTCYVFPPIDDSSEVDSSTRSFDSPVFDYDSQEEYEVIQELSEDTTSTEFNANSLDLQTSDEKFEVLAPSKIYLNNTKSNKRKLSSRMCKKIKKFKKASNIDATKVTNNAKEQTSCSKHHEEVLKYVDSLDFSLCIPYIKEPVYVNDAMSDWPIQNAKRDPSFAFNKNQSFDIFNEIDNASSSHPLNQTLEQEISSDYSTEPINSEDSLSNFQEGFGERSDRVILNSNCVGDILESSAATLSDVKQIQPLSSSSQSSIFGFSHILEKHFKRIEVRRKIQAFFDETSVELHKNVNEKCKKDLDSDSIFQSIPGLYDTQFINPSNVMQRVYVVQVGQLPVSAAAQNPVTCDPRVTHVSDVSPSQCSIENSPHSDNSQPSMKVEYTELTNADLSIPLLQNQTDSRTPENANTQNISRPITAQMDIEGSLNQDNNDRIHDDAQKSENNSNNATDSESVVNMNSVPYSQGTNGSSNQEFSFKSTDENRNLEKAELTNEIKSTQHSMVPETMQTQAQTHINIVPQQILPNNTVINNSSPYHHTAISAMTLQQALAQISSLNTSSSNDGNRPAVGPQLLHIVQGKNIQENQQSINIGAANTQLLHIVQNKVANSVPTTSESGALNSNSLGGISLMDTGIQGSNQLLHIVNAGNQKNANLLKTVNLLTNLANCQPNNEQKMVQFVCKSADGKSIHLNAPHQRSMVLRLQPIETPQSQPTITKANDRSDMNMTPANGNATDKESNIEMKTQSVYEDYTKYVQGTNKPPPTSESSTSLPKFNQVFGKSIYQEGSPKQDEINDPELLVNNAEDNVCSSIDNNLNMDSTNQLSSPPLLIRKTIPNTSQPQPNLVHQIKQNIAPVNIQTMHGGVIYTRQIPVNLGGQTINLITVPSTDIPEDSNKKQSTETDSTAVKIGPQETTNSEKTEDNTNNNENPPTQAQPQVLTHMRIKLPMLSKVAPQMVPGARLVRPSFFQIQRNIIGGANQPVYQQYVLAAGPSLGHQTIKLPQTQVRPSKPETQTSDTHMSSSTLEQLREFDMVLEQVKERSTGQPGTPNPYVTVSQSETSTAPTIITNQQVLYSVRNNQGVNVAYVRKPVANIQTATLIRSPDTTAVADSPSSNPQTPITEGNTLSENVNSKIVKTHTKTKSRPKPAPTPNTVKLNHTPTKTSTQKPLEDEQTTQRILYILAEYKEQVENSPDKDKPAPRRRTNLPPHPGSKRKKSSSGSRRPGCTRDHSPILGEDSCRTMGSEDSSCGTSQGDWTESCSLDTNSPQDSPRKIVRKLSFEQDNNPMQRSMPARNLIVADGQAFALARGTPGKPTTLLMPANYILPVSMVKGGQQIAIVTNRGPKLLTVGGTGETGAANALVLQRLISPAGLKPVLTRPGVRHVRLPATALHNLQTFNLSTNTNPAPPVSESSASPLASATRSEATESRASTSPWADRGNCDARADNSSSDEAWHTQSSAETQDYPYDDPAPPHVENGRTVLGQMAHRYSPDLEAQRIFDKMFDVDAKKSYVANDSSRITHAYDLEAQSDSDDRVFQQKSLSEECEDLGVDSPSAAELFPEADLLFTSSPAGHDHQPNDGAASHTHHGPHPVSNQTPSTLTHAREIHTRTVTAQLAEQPDLSDVNLGLGDVNEELQNITLDQEEFARSHPNTTFHSEISDGEEVQPFTIKSGQVNTIFHATAGPATVLMTSQHSVISQANQDIDQQEVKYDMVPSNVAILQKDERLTRYNDREIHISNPNLTNTTQVIKRVTYDDKNRYLLDEPEGLIAGKDAKMAAVNEDNSRDATLDSITCEEEPSSPDRHNDLFWESNSERSESRRPLDFSSDSDKCCKSPYFDETNSDSSICNQIRLDSVIKEARVRSGSADGSSDDTIHPPLRTYPAKRTYEAERSLTGKTRVGEKCDSPEVRRRASVRGVVKRGCHCCNGSPAPPRTKKQRQRKTTEPHHGT